MALISRITRLFQADLHAVLDRIEEPGQLLRQSIREMEEALAAAEQRLKAGAETRAALTRRRDELERRLTELDDELDLCFAAEKPELARGLVRRKLETARLLQHVEDSRRENEERLAAGHAAAAEHRATLESLRQKAEVLAPRMPEDPQSFPDEPAWTARELSVTEEEVDVALLRERRARSRS